MLLLIGTCIGFLVGRIVPPRKPISWSRIHEGMDYSDVYREVPNLRGSMRTEKGFDTCDSEFGSSYWQLFVYYDDKGKVNQIETKLYW